MSLAPTFFLLASGLFFMVHPGNDRMALARDAFGWFPEEQRRMTRAKPQARGDRGLLAALRDVSAEEPFPAADPVATETDDRVAEDGIDTRDHEVAEHPSPMLRKFAQIYTVSTADRVERGYTRAMDRG